MRSEERDDFEGSESSSIVEPLEDFGNIICGIGDQAIDGRDGVVGATGQELQTRSTL